MSGRRSSHVVVVGAGAGGLAAALGLAASGVAVTLLERAEAPGGKMREVEAGGARIDAGPTVFTMRWVFDALFAQAGTSLDAHLTLRPLDVLARHAWTAREHLDLFADRDRAADAIGDFAGPGAARGYHAFTERARRVYGALETPFIRAQRPSALSLVAGAGARGIAGLAAASPFSTLWRALGEDFHDPRLRQLFGRYATYTGASPFEAPAILMLIAHVEQEGVWTVDAGMHRVATALAGVAAALGVAIRYGAHVEAIDTTGGRVGGVTLADGERIAADAVVVNADVAALADGLFGRAVAGAVARTSQAERSLSAVTWAMRATARGFPLSRHTVFFAADYAAEFAAIFGRRELPEAPTVYVCAQDRDGAGAAPDGPERLLCLVNAPAIGAALADASVDACEARAFGLLERCGLTLERSAANTVRTTPAGFADLFPATGGALYGRALHGPMTAFKRPGSRTRLPGLYLAGGSVHPGAGVPMAILSGQRAAESVLADLRR